MKLLKLKQFCLDDLSKLQPRSYADMESKLLEWAFCFYEQKIKAMHHRKQTPTSYHFKNEKAKEFDRELKRLNSKNNLSHLVVMEDD